MDNKLRDELEVILYEVGEIGVTKEFVNKVLSLFTPKLQWKVEEITNEGGDNLLCIQYYLQDSSFVVVILDNKLTGKCCVRWDFKHVFEGTLEECKQFCSNKILNDFLKLCE